MRFAVVGHVEWVEFLRVERLPRRGEIAHSTDSVEEPAGGGAVAAVQLARLSADSTLRTALGADALAPRSKLRLAELGVHVTAAIRHAPTRRAITQIDPRGERTITTIGRRLAPRGEDPLRWEELSSVDGVYFTAGDAAALAAARAARVLVATPRAGAVLTEAGIELDALVYSENDELERTGAAEVRPRPSLIVATRGSDGGHYVAAGGDEGDWAPVPPPGPIADSYGAGDSFAAALTWALAADRGTAEAIEIAARAGAVCTTGQGPYERQLTGAELSR